MEVRSKGVIVIELEDVLTPITVSNFLSYVDSGYYSGLIFHRVIRGYMVQAGGFDSHMNRKGTNGAIKNEAQSGLHNTKMTIAMARTSALDSATSQFYINTEDNGFLDYSATSPGYAAFGTVRYGYDVVRSIEKEETHSYKGYADVPRTPQIIDSVYRAACTDPADDSPLGVAAAPDSFVVAVNTSVGSFEVEATRSWAPYGVDRFYELCARGYYNDTRIYRMIDTWVAQFGVAGTPAVAAKWVDRYIPDDTIPTGVHNDEGFLTFSAAYDGKTGVATNRTTELFINLENHRELDALGFPPIGVVRGDGMEVVHRFFAGYGEMEDTCELHGFVPCQGPNNTCVYDGNSCLDQHYPNLTKIYSMTIIEEYIRPRHEWQPPRDQNVAVFTPRDLLLVFCSLMLIALVAMCLARLRSQYHRNPKGRYTPFPADVSTNPIHGSMESDSDEGVLTDSDDDGEEGALELTVRGTADVAAEREPDEPPGDDV